MNSANIWKSFIYNYVEENDLLIFYTRFLEEFEIKWDKLVAGYNFENLCQINNGNRLRPMLVYWGYLLNKDNDSLFNIDDEEIHYVLDFCIMVEIIHKMSLLIDDWIDNDTARHGFATFHTIYGADAAVLLAVNLLLKGYLQLSDKLSTINEKIFRKTMALTLQISYEMTLGALNEVSSKEKTFSISEVKEIVNFETASIIKNGIVVGYAAGAGSDESLIDLMEDIGYCCGYIFQALNDMEPFGNIDELIKHKGTLTTDIIENRKNIVVAYIYTWADKGEIKQLESLEKAEAMSDCISSLIHKYDIKKYLIQEISNLQLRINDRLAKIEMKTGHSEWCKHFKHFIEITISASKKRALGQYTKAT